MIKAYSPKRSPKQIVAARKGWRTLRLRGALKFLAELGVPQEDLAPVNYQAKIMIKKLFLHEMSDPRNLPPL